MWTGEKKSMESLMGECGQVWLGGWKRWKGKGVEEWLEGVESGKSGKVDGEGVVRKVERVEIERWRKWSEKKWRGLERDGR